jgi:exodeoxyribonuclease III
MKLICWNVNGLRAILKKGFTDFVAQENPDIICLQEIKAMQEQIGEILPDYPFQYYYSAQRKGYSGTAILSKTRPLAVQFGFGLPEYDTEGRVITCEFENYFVVTVYTPNAKPDLSRLEYRHKYWDVYFLQHVMELDKKKPVIFCGDLNVAHQEIDLKNPKQNRGEHGFTDEEREGFSNFLSGGFVDTFRELYPQKIMYSWWSNFGNARANNTGWRIDYVLTSRRLFPFVKESFILPHVLGSDHCPVGILLDEN